MRLVANAAAKRSLAPATITRFMAAAVMVGLLGTSSAMAQGPRGPGDRPMDRPSQSEENVADHVQTVRDLAAVCDPRVGGMRRLEAIAYCQGYLTAAGQYHALLFPTGGRARPLFCVPSPGPSIAEAGIGFASWARANPGRRNEPALDGFLRWAQDRFPCPDAPRPGRNRSQR